MNAPHTVETERLLLRPFVEDDAEEFFRFNNDPLVMRYTGNPLMGSVEEARAGLLSRPIADYRTHGYGRWACVCKADGKLIGFAGLKFLPELNEVDLGYRLLPAYWGKGLATEASVASLGYGFDRLGLRRIIGLVDPENVASVRVLEKVGMRFEDHIDYFDSRVARYAITSPGGRSAVQ
jgi:[ribosomal protein S5]-alanine N-acetyltransferase